MSKVKPRAELKFLRKAEPYIRPNDGSIVNRNIYLCFCGKETKPMPAFRSKTTQSCGCLVKENKGAPIRTVVEAGDKFHELTIVRECPRREMPGGTKVRVMLCKCSCGNLTEVFLTSLVSKRQPTKTCGKCDVHGMCNTPEYHAWEALKQRCTNTEHPAYKNYGGRGITYHPSFEDFPTFLKEIGERPSSKHSIDRRDNDLGYVPGNLRWATRAQQNNNRRGNQFYTFDGKTQTLQEWSIALGIHEDTLWARIHTLKWTILKTFTTTVKR